MENLSENAEHADETAANFQSRLDERNGECDIV